MVSWPSLVVQAEPFTYSKTRLPLSSTTGPLFATPKLLMDTVSAKEPCNTVCLRLLLETAGFIPQEINLLLTVIRAYDVTTNNCVSGQTKLRKT